jgi:AraC-like DNA-binding protein
VLAERPEIELSERGELATLTFLPLGVSEPGKRIRRDLGVLGLTRLVCYVGAAGPSSIRRVAFEHGAPAYTSEYTRLFHGQARFGQRFSGIEFERTLLDRPRHDRNAEWHQTIAVLAQQLVDRVQRDTTLVDQLRSHMRSMFPRLLSIGQAAHGLAMSERSLRRRLLLEGTSYSAILQESQSLVAQRLLGDRSRSIQEVAHDVGFANTSAFHRAFKRWTGESPATFRERLRTAPQA